MSWSTETLSDLPVVGFCMNPRSCWICSDMRSRRCCSTSRWSFLGFAMVVSEGCGSLLRCVGVVVIGVVAVGVEVVVGVVGGGGCGGGGVRAGGRWDCG